MSQHFCIATYQDLQMIELTIERHHFYSRSWKCIIWIPWQTAFISSNGYTFSVSFFFSPSGRLRNDLHFLPNFNLFIAPHLIIFALKNPRRDRGFRMGMFEQIKENRAKRKHFLCQLPKVFFHLRCYDISLTPTN